MTGPRTRTTGRFTPPDPGPVFTPPRLPAARCLHALRRLGALPQRDIAAHTGLSAATVSRAIRSLTDAGFVEPCPEGRAEGRGAGAAPGLADDVAEDLAAPPLGRPSQPLCLSTGTYYLGGVAIGTRNTYFALYDLRGRTIVDTYIALDLSSTPPAEATQHVVAGVHRLLTLAREHHNPSLSLAALGVSTPGLVSIGGSVDAAHLHWERLNLREQLSAHFTVPLSIGAAVPAILAAELQNSPLPDQHSAEERTAVFYADDSLGAAIAHLEGLHSVASIPTLAPPGRAEDVEFLADMVDLILDAPEGPVRTIVLAGQHITHDARVPHRIAAEVRRRHALPLTFRLIPTHEEIVRGIARAVATDSVLRDPLGVSIPQ